MARKRDRKAKRLREVQAELAKRGVKVVVSGSGGGGKAGGSSGGAREYPNTLRAKSIAKIVELISEGPVWGLDYTGDIENKAKSIQLSETPVMSAGGTVNHQGVTFHERTGYPDQEPILGFDATETEVGAPSSGTEISYGTPRVVSNVSAPGITAVRVKVSMNQCTEADPETGDLKKSSVQYKVYVTSSDGETVAITDVIDGKCVSYYARDYRIDLPGIGPWEIKVERLSPDAATVNIQNKIYFPSYTLISDGKLMYPNSAVVALELDAELFGTSIPSRGYLVKGLIVKVPANYDPEAGTYATTGTGTSSGLWDGTFKNAWTDNPIWVLYDLLTNTRYGLGIDPSMVDSASFYQISQYCDAYNARETGPRTNYLLWSNDLSNGVWIYNDATSADGGLDPLGRAARKIIPTATSTTVHRVYQNLQSPHTTYPDNSVVTFSFMAKADGYGFVRAQMLRKEGSGNTLGFFNLSTGAFSGLLSGVTGSAEDMGDGWWRVSFTRSIDAGTTVPAVYIWVQESAATTTFAGDGIKGVLIGSTQFEISSSFTKFIPTTSATVTVGSTDDYHPVTGRHGVPDGDGGFERRFTFNYAFSGREDAYKVLQSVAASFRGMCYWSSGAVTVVADMPSDPVKLVTKANVIDGKFSYTGSSRTARHSVALVTWNDPNDNYRPAIEVVEDADQLEIYGDNSTDITLIGCTKRSEANRYGRWTLDTERYCNEQLAYRASWENADLVPGDIILVSDATYAGAKLGGRVTASTTTTLRLDNNPTLVGSSSIRVVSDDGEIYDRAILSTSVSGGLMTVTVDALPDAPPVGSVWIITTDVVPRQFRVMSNKELSSGEFEIVALEHDPDKYERVEWGMTLPPQTHVRIDKAATVDEPGAATITESYYFANNQTRTRMIVSWPRGTDPLVTAYEIRYKAPTNPTYVGPFRTDSFTYEIPDAEIGDYEINIRALSADGRSSEWSEELYTVVGKDTPPGAPSNLTAMRALGSSVLSWDLPADTDLAYTEVWARETTNNRAGAAKIGQSAGTSYTHGELTNGNDWYYWIRCVDTSGNIGDYNAGATSGVVGGGSAIDYTDLDSTAPATPTGLSLSSAAAIDPVVGDPEVRLIATWTANTEPDLAGYEIEVSEDGGTPWVVVAVTNRAEFPVRGQTDYRARVRAFDRLGNRSAFTSLTGWHTTAKDASAPSAPAGLAATGLFNSVALAWTNPSATDLSHVEVYRNTSNSIPATPIATPTATPSVSGRHVDGGLAVNTEYFYWLKAVDTSGNVSTATTSVSATTARVTTTDFTPGITPLEYADYGVPTPSTANAPSLPGVGNFEGRQVFNTNSADRKLYIYRNAAWSKAVDGADLTAASLGLAAFSSGITPVERVAALPTSGTYQGRVVMLTTDGKIYRHTTTATNGSGWSKTTDGGDLVAGTVTATAIAAATITGDRIAANTIVASRLALSDSSNLVQDPGFYDTGTTTNSYWVVSPSHGTLATVADSVVAAMGVPTALRSVVGNGTTSQGISEFYVSPNSYPLVEPGKVYRVSALARVTAGFTGRVRALVRWYKQDGTAASTGSTSILGPSYLTTAAGVETQTLIEGQVTAPADAFRARFSLYTDWSTTQNNAGYAYYAFPRWHRAAAAELLVDGSITAAKITAGTITGDRLVAGAITAGLLAAGSVTASKLYVGDTSNMFPDPDMVDTAVYSTTSTPAGAFALGATGGTFASRQRVLVSSNASDTNVVCSAIPVEANKPYFVSSQIGPVTASDHTCYLYAKWYSMSSVGALTFISQELVASSSAASTSASLNKIVTAPASARRLILEFVRGGGGSAQGSWASPVVRRASNGELIVDGTITATKIQASTITGDRIAGGTITGSLIAASTITASRLLIGDTSNVFPDPNMQDVNSYVTGATLGAATVINNNTSTGIALQASSDLSGSANRLLVNTLAATTQYVWSSPIQVEAGKPYFWSIAAYRAATGGAYSVEIEFYSDAAGTTVTGSVVALVTAGTATTLTRYTGNFNAAALARSARFKFTVGTGTAAADAYFMEPIMRRATTAELIVDGSITAAKLNVSTLSAITANIGTVTAGLIQNHATTPSFILDAANGQITNKSGGYVTYQGTGFGASSDLLFWFGADSVAIGSATKANSQMALGTDGKLYYGSDNRPNSYIGEYTDDAAADAAGGKNGDLYLNTTYRVLKAKTAGAWTRVTQNSTYSFSATDQNINYNATMPTTAFWTVTLPETVTVNDAFYVTFGGLSQHDGASGTPGGTGDGNTRCSTTTAANVDFSWELWESPPGASSDAMRRKVLSGTGVGQVANPGGSTTSDRKVTSVLIDNDTATYAGFSKMFFFKGAGSVDFQLRIHSTTSSTNLLDLTTLMKVIVQRN